MQSLTIFGTLRLVGARMPAVSLTSVIASLRGKKELLVSKSSQRPAKETSQVAPGHSRAVVEAKGAHGDLHGDAADILRGVHS